METATRIARLEGQVRVLRTVLILGTVAVFVGAWRSSAGQLPDTLRVRQITVVDANGTERVWIGAPVPDPIMQGKHMKRAAVASGIILLDAHGDERGGFLTSDTSSEIWVGLDSEKGQEATFLANAAGGAHLSLWDENRSQAKMSLVGGRPVLLLRHKGETVFEQPPAK
jgi:hypothetical protein